MIHKLPNSLQQSQNPHPGHIVSILRLIKRDSDMRLGRKVINLVRLISI